MMENKRKDPTNLSPKQGDELMKTLKTRFEAYMDRHEGLDWAAVQAKLEENPKKLWSLNEMERTGGEPDVVRYAESTGEFVFVDCAKQSPQGHRRLCYDEEAWESREANKPEGGALEMAEEMGINLLTESDYRELQN